MDESKLKSSIRYPLDHALASEAQVRLLRVLLMHPSAPLSVTETARLAGLTAAGARRALDRLRGAGFVDRVGTGHAFTYAVRDGAVGMRALAQAFEEERTRYDYFLATLRDAVSIPEVTAAWIEGLPVAPSDPVYVSAVVEARAVPWIQDELRARLVGLEKEFDIIVEVAVYTRADSPTPTADASMLWGVHPGSQEAGRPPAKTHSAATRRQLLMSRQIADMVRRDPTLIERARRHVMRLLNEEQGMARSDTLEWRQLLENYSPARLADLLGSESSRAERLRQSSPFFAVLTSSERDAILE
ncbi:ArsR family transcriptional regulator, partial [bacterium]|nr:ArsR family transcriptional regulator [bacterium]